MARTEKQRAAWERNHKIRQLRMMHGVSKSVLDHDLWLNVQVALDAQLIRLGALTNIEHIRAVLAKHKAAGT